VSADAKFRHILGWSYAQTGHTPQARREYRRVLEIEGLDPDIKARVQTSLDALG
jgi:Flp pilus assembly protein TadD